PLLRQQVDVFRQQAVIARLLEDIGQIHPLRLAMQRIQPYRPKREYKWLSREPPPIMAQVVEMVWRIVHRDLSGRVADQQRGIVVLQHFLQVRRMGRELAMSTEKLCKQNLGQSD